MAAGCLPPPQSRLPPLTLPGRSSGFVDPPHFRSVQRDPRGARPAEQPPHAPARVGQRGCHATAADRWLTAGGSEGGLMAVAAWTRPDMLSRYTRAGAGQRAPMRPAA